MAIPTVEEAATQLQSLLGRLNQDISDADRSAVSDELVAFANPASGYAVPALPAYAELRETALRTSEELDRKLTRAALKRIRDRSEAISRLVAAIDSVTDKAEKDAQTLRLEVINHVLASTQSAVDAVNTAREAFEEGRTSDGYAALADTLKEIESLRNGVARRVDPS
jgi:hypothetical protein